MRPVIRRLKMGKQYFGYRTFKSRTKDLKLPAKLAVVLFLIVLIRIGSSYPLPFVNGDYMRGLLGMQGLAFLNAMTGGSMQQMSLFALSISPYITASIIMQLMTVIFPGIEEMQKDGKTGQDRFKNITRILAAVLSVLQSAAMAIGLGAKGLLITYTPATVLIATLVWSIGGVILIGISSYIDWMEIGNGISIILCANILSTFPSDLFVIRDVYLTNRLPAVMGVNVVLITMVFLAVIAACAALYMTQKEIPVVNSRKLAGSVNKSTFPIPLNTCSVMPVIFASSIISMPLIVVQFLGKGNDGILMHIAKGLSSNEWFKLETPQYSVGALFYFLLTTFFTYFYLEIGFNPMEIADNLKKSGATIPGIRPGKPTEEYIRKWSVRIALTGNTITTALILTMHAICNNSGMGTLSITGTSIIILVGVVVEEKKLFASLLAVSRLRYKKKGSLIHA